MPPPWCSRTFVSPCIVSAGATATYSRSITRTPWHPRRRYADADELMAAVAGAGRTIAWVYEQSWGGHVRNQVKRHPRLIAPGVELAHGSMELLGSASPADDPTLVLAVAIAAARRETPIGRSTLTGCAPSSCHGPTATARAGQLVRSTSWLRCSSKATGRSPSWKRSTRPGLLSRILPEWQAVRSKPQRNAYRFTVDRHLWETAANAAQLTSRVSRPDLLLLGAMFHDLGKGYLDYTDAGVELFDAIGVRLGLNASDVDVVVHLVRNHLLLPSVAVNRDLADPATIAAVAEQVRSVDELELLHALTVADSLATGPTAWSSWKEDLVQELVDRTRERFDGASSAVTSWQLFPDADTLEAMAADRQSVLIAATWSRWCRSTCPDRSPGSPVRCRCAGSTCSARGGIGAGSGGAGRMGASQFRVLSPSPVDEQAVTAMVERALAGELAIEARVADRARSIRKRRLQQAEPPSPPTIAFLDEASHDSTVIEVRANRSRTPPPFGTRPRRRRPRHPPRGINTIGPEALERSMCVTTQANRSPTTSTVRRSAASPTPSLAD